MPNVTLGLVPHPTKSVHDSLDVLRRWKYDNQDVNLIALASDEHRVGDGVELVSRQAFIERSDALVALGGDGTMLGAMRLAASGPIPVLGVNYGTVGYLVEIEPEDLEDALERISAENYQLEAHHALELTLTSAGMESTFLAFNDVVIARQPGSGVVSADLYVDGTGYGYYQADAIVVATPSGSTAYNYAAGGPVLSPAIVATVVTPVAPMAGISRSVVLCDQERLRLSVVEATGNAALEIDGRVVSEVAAGAELHIQMRRDAGMVIRLDASRHARKGRVKMSLLDLPLRKDQLLELVPSELREREAAATSPDPGE